MKSQFFLISMTDARDSRKVIHTVTLDNFKNVAFFRSTCEVNNASGYKNCPAKVTIKVAHASSTLADTLEEFSILDSVAAKRMLIDYKTKEVTKK